MKYSSQNYKCDQSKKYVVYKKIAVVMIAFIGCIGVGYAQEISSNAIGLRFGDNDGFGAEISYQRKLKEDTRLELDLGFRDDKNYDIWKLSAVHQWVWNIDGGFNWYAGFGAGIGNINSNDASDDDGFFLNGAGNVGIEYNFEIPLLISLDLRPEIGIVNDFGNNDLDLDIALGLRYQF